MKHFLFCLSLSFGSLKAHAQQQFTFEKQMEQAWLDFHRNGAQMIRSDLKTIDNSTISDEQFDAIGAIMQAKDGYIRLIRQSSNEVTLIHASFLPDHDKLSIFRHAGVEVQIISTKAEPLLQAVE